MFYTKEKVISILNLLGIEYDARDISNKGWMSIKCPLHVESTPWGSASVNINSGIISCFSCGQTISLKKLLEQRNISNFEEFVPKYFAPTTYVQEKKEIINHDYNFAHFELDPLKYKYTRIRGYTKKYCEEFNIVHCISGDYRDFFTIPIIDSKQDIRTYEARKLCKDIYLKNYYKDKKLRMSLEELFEKECEDKNYEIKKGEIFDEAGNQYFSLDLLYLLKPKVLYPWMSGVWTTIFNIDNLDYNQDLWISEGLGTHPKLYQYISKNSSAVFGAKITPEQFVILKKFKKRIIILVDPDIAGYKMILSAFENLKDVWVCFVSSKDENKNFVKDVENCKLISSNEFLIKYTFS